MNKLIISAQQSAITGELARKGYIDSTIFQSFYKQKGFDFLQALHEVAKSLQWSSKKSKSAAVFQTISILKDYFEVTAQIKQLKEMKRMDLTRILTKLIVPNSQHRKKISTIRLKVLKQIKSGEEVNPSDMKILNQLYKLLTFGSEQFHTEDKQKIKKSLTSLKKLMGSEYTFQEDEKRDKKKAYQENLMLRQIIEFSLDNVSSFDLKVKAKELLKSPKNKKWFGIRLYKLLAQNNWSSQEMLTLAKELEKTKKLEKVGNIKIRLIRSKLGKLINKIQSFSLNQVTVSSNCSSVIIQCQQQSRKLQKREINDNFQEEKINEKQSQNSFLNNFIFPEFEYLELSEYLL